MPVAVEQKRVSPGEITRMMAAMSPENYDALSRIIMHVYNDDAEARKTRSDTEKLQALQRMEELRAHAGDYYPPDFDAEKEIADAMEAKYGRSD